MYAFNSEPFYKFFFYFLLLFTGHGETLFTGSARNTMKYPVFLEIPGMGGGEINALIKR